MCFVPRGYSSFSIVFADLLQAKPRLEDYCPRCQLRYTDDPSKTPFSPVPPSYESLLPPYSLSPHPNVPLQDSKGPGCIHYLRHNDTLIGLSLMYKIPLQDIRRANNLFGNDNLMHARHYVFIPGYNGPSLSREPEEPEEVEIRKIALKRFQLISKCVDYKMATIYMENSGWNIEAAVEKYNDDIAWEKAHPVRDGKQKSRTTRR